MQRVGYHEVHDGAGMAGAVAGGGGGSEGMRGGKGGAGYLQPHCQRTWTRLDARRRLCQGVEGKVTVTLVLHR